MRAPRSVIKFITALTYSTLLGYAYSTQTMVVGPIVTGVSVA